MDEGEIDGQGMSAAVGTVAEDQFAEDDRVAQGLFGIVISRGHAVDVEESKEPVVVALGIAEPLAQVFGFGVMAGTFAGAVERSV